MSCEAEVVLVDQTQAKREEEERGRRKLKGERGQGLEHERGVHFWMGVSCRPLNSPNLACMGALSSL